MELKARPIRHSEFHSSNELMIHLIHKLLSQFTFKRSI